MMNDELQMMKGINSEMKISNEELERYSRQMQLSGWGIETQLKLKSSRVLVVGAGALGCAVMQNLSLTGIGTLGIADADIISLSNLQRQVLFNETDIGFPKTQKAKEKIEKLNPFVKVELFHENIFEGNVLSILKEYDIIVDGSDNFETKYLLNDACVILNKPLVSGSIESFEGQISVFNFMDGPTYRCLFPFPPDKENSADCNTIGVTATLPLIIGNIQANEAVKIISGTGEVLSGKFLLVNMLTNSFLTLGFKTNPENKNISELEKRYDFNSCAKADVVSVSLEEMRSESKNFWLLDVRPEDEHRQFNIGGKNIPVYEIESLLGEIPSDKNILTYCNGGTSAKLAAFLISSRKNRRVYYLDSSLEIFKNNF